MVHEVSAYIHLACLKYQHLHYNAIHFILLIRIIIIVCIYLFENKSTQNISGT